MEQILDAPKRNSRRRFIKSATGLLLGTPVLSSLISCGRAGQSLTATTDCPSVPTGGAIATACRQGGFLTHEPPVGLGGGSFYLELNAELDPPTSAPPYNIYKKQGSTYLAIASVKVITELRTQVQNSHITDVVYTPSSATELWIWLEGMGSISPGCYYDIPMSTLPNIKLICDAENLKVYVNNDQFDHEDTHKCNIPHRYKHRGNGLGGHFRIAKWAIVDSSTQRPVQFVDSCDSSSVNGWSSGDDSYHLYVLFSDPTNLAQWQL